MTVDQILQGAHRLYDGTIEYPTSGEEDYELRLGLLNLGMQVKDEQESIVWNDQIKSLDEASDGDKVTTTAKVYDAPSDFRYTTTRVSIDGRPIRVVLAQHVGRLQEEGVSYQYCYFTGTPGNSKLHLSFTPETGKTIEYNYYASAEQYTTGNQPVRITHPLFLINFIAWKLFEQDTGRGDMVTLYSGASSEVMASMIGENEHVFI